MLEGFLVTFKRKPILIISHVCIILLLSRRQQSKHTNASGKLDPRLSKTGKRKDNRNTVGCHVVYYVVSLPFLMLLLAVWHSSPTFMKCHYPISLPASILGYREVTEEKVVTTAEEYQ